MSGEVEVTVTGVDVVGGGAEVCKGSFTALAIGVVTAFTTVVTAGMVALAKTVGAAFMVGQTTDCDIAAGGKTALVFVASGAVVESGGFCSIGPSEVMDIIVVCFKGGIVETGVTSGGEAVTLPLTGPVAGIQRGA